MLQWLLNLIGISDTLIDRVHEVQWVIARPALFWAGIVLLLPLGALIARRHRTSLGHLTRAQRHTLTACRLGVLAVLVFVLGAPYLQLEYETERRPVLALLIDDSASMDLPIGDYPPEQHLPLARLAGLIEASEDATRSSANQPTDPDAPLEPAVRRQLHQLTRRALTARALRTHQADLLETLSERFELRAYRFARTTELIRLDTWPDRLTHESDTDGDRNPASTADTAATFDRRATDLGRALERALDEAAGRELAGLVVISDGQSNVGTDALDTLSRRLATTGGGARSLWAVPVGAPEPIDDVAVVEAVAPSRAAPGDSVTITARLRAHGFADQAVTLELREHDRLLDQRELHLTEGRSEPVELRFVAEEPGTRLLELAVASPAGDRVPANDRMPVTVTVDDQRWQILYIDGYPRWDFRFLDHALRRSGSLDVTMVLESEFTLAAATAPDEAHDERTQAGAPTSPPTASTAPERLAEVAGLPDSVEALAEYDVVMLGDVSPRLADPRFLTQLKRAVQAEGVGLVIQAGPQHMPPAFSMAPSAICCR